MQLILPDVVIHHAPCADGTLSAFLVKDYLEKTDTGNIEHIIGIKPGYEISEDVLEKCLDKVVLMLDVLYKREDMAKLRAVTYNGTELYAIDHHRSNIRALNEEGQPPFFDNDHAILDESNAACMLTWNWLHGENPAPDFVHYVAARDMYVFNDLNTQPFSAGLWDESTRNPYMAIFKRCMYDPEFTKVLIDQGREITMRQNIMIEHFCKIARKFTIKTAVREYTVWGTPTHDYRSDVANKLAERNDCDFALTYHYDIKSREWWVALRASKKSTIDLSIVAKEIEPSGGGHPKASGLTYKGDIADLLVPFIDDTL